MPAHSASASPSPMATQVSGANNQTTPPKPPINLPGQLPPSSSAPSTTVPSATPAPVNPPSADADVIHIPSYSRWFSWNGVHECEVRFLPEFFDGRSPSKNPKVYKYYRNAIIKRFRQNPSRKITFTDARKTIVGDVGSIRKVFDFLETWGLINYSGGPSSKPHLKWEEKETKSAAAGSDAPAGSGVDVPVPKKRLCNSCKSVCSIACFYSETRDVTLCARCYVRLMQSLSTSDFKRVEITEEVKTDWTEKETLHLLEGIMHYGNDWKRIAEHVGGRSEKECVARFIKLPFGEQFDGPPESAEVDYEFGLQNLSMPAKRMRLSPLADTSNPIMAQAAFLSTLAGVDVAEGAARAAVTVLSDLGDNKLMENLKSSFSALKQQESVNPSNGKSTNSMEGALVEANLQLDKEEEELEKAISGIAGQIREIEDKIAHFEELDMQTEKRRRQLQQLQNLLFVDQHTLLSNKPATPKAGDRVGDGIKTE